jgi:DNA helicase HerA-like ATPase
VVVQGLDLVDITTYIDKKNKKFQAILLTEIEEIIDKDSPEFKAIRKQVLDGYNNYTRSIVRAIFGDVESM